MEEECILISRRGSSSSGVGDCPWSYFTGEGCISILLLILLNRIMWVWHIYVHMQICQLNYFVHIFVLCGDGAERVQGSKSL